MWWVENWRELLTGWARGLVLVVGLAALVDIIMPRGSFRRFGQLAMGLFVLLAMARPLMELPPGAAGFWPALEQAAYAPAAARAGAAGTARLMEATLSHQLAGSVAAALALPRREVEVRVWWAGDRLDWPSRPRRIEIRLMRWPEGIGGPGEAWEALAAQVAAQIAAAYRLDQDQVRVLPPR